MIEKKEQIIIVFDKTIDAMAMEDYCLKNGVKGRLIPLPSEISEGCGLCWKTDVCEKENIINVIKNAKLKYSQIIKIFI